MLINVFGKWLNTNHIVRIINHFCNEPFCEIVFTKGDNVIYEKHSATQVAEEINKQLKERE
jgi:hypothetical protein